MTRLRAAPATPALPATAVMKLALLLRTVARPSLAFSRTTCPPAALMVALAAVAEARLVYSTTYSVAPVTCWVAALLAGDWLLAPALNGTASVSPTIATSPPIRSFRTASSSSSSEHSTAPGTPEGAYESERCGSRVICQHSTLLPVADGHIGTQGRDTSDAGRGLPSQLGISYSAVSRHCSAEMARGRVFPRRASSPVRAC